MIIILLMHNNVVKLNLKLILIFNVIKIKFFEEYIYLFFYLAILYV